MAEWNVKIAKNESSCEVLSPLVPYKWFAGKVSEKDYEYRWEAGLETVFIRKKGELLERSLKVRSCFVSSQNEEPQLSFSLSSGMTLTITANLFPSNVLSKYGSKKSGSKQKNLKSPMTGKVLKINTKAGDIVQKGDTLAVIEAMKMENNIKAPSSGVVGSITIKELDTVQVGDLLMRLDENGN